MYLRVAFHHECTVCCCSRRQHKSACLPRRLDAARGALLRRRGERRSAVAAAIAAAAVSAAVSAPTVSAAAVSAAVAAAARAAAAVAAAVAASFSAPTRAPSSVAAAVAATAVAAASLPSPVASPPATPDAIPGELDSDLHAARLDVRGGARRVWAFRSRHGRVPDERDVARGLYALSPVRRSSVHPRRADGCQVHRLRPGRRVGVDVGRMRARLAWQPTGRRPRQSGPDLLMP